MPVGQMIDGVKRVNTSQKFSKRERAWRTIGQECFAIYHALVHWEHILLGLKFIVQTDHRNLMYLDKSSAPKLIRWRLRIQEFNFVVEHVSGVEKCLAITVTDISSPDIMGSVGTKSPDTTGTESEFE